MKTLTVRLAEGLVAEIEAESRGRRPSKSDIVRERLSLARSGR
jgi:Arc/MetJ-type ribon-helix-helix transcriptional regulator